MGDVKESIMEDLFDIVPKKVTSPDGTTRYYDPQGHLHREGKPAVKKPNGTRKYYRHGQLFRADGPAIIRANGMKVWYQLIGVIHRSNGPAITNTDGSYEWLQDGRHHNPDGPAITTAEGLKIWFYRGRYLRSEIPDRSVKIIEVPKEGTRRKSHDPPVVELLGLAPGTSPPKATLVGEHSELSIRVYMVSSYSRIICETKTGDYYMYDTGYNTKQRSAMPKTQWVSAVMCDGTIIRHNKVPSTGPQAAQDADVSSIEFPSGYVLHWNGDPESWRSKDGSQRYEIETGAGRLLPPDISKWHIFQP